MNIQMRMKCGGTGAVFTNLALQQHEMDQEHQQDENGANLILIPGLSQTSCVTLLPGPSGLQFPHLKTEWVKF